MPSLSDYPRGKYIKALVYGKFKTGKTAGAATFPRPNILDFDRGTLTLSNPEMEKKFGFSKRGIMLEQFTEKSMNKYGVITSHNAFNDACRYFDECMKPSGKWVSPLGRSFDVGVDQFDTWVIDSGTTLSQVAKNKALILLGGSATGAKSQTHKLAVDTGLVSMKEQDFGAERSMVEQFIDMVMATNKHVLLLCHEKDAWEGKGESAKMVGIVPLFTGQSAELIPLKFDEVWNLRIKPSGATMVRTLQTVADSYRACGSRLGVPDGTVFEYDALRAALNL